MNEPTKTLEPQENQFDWTKTRITLKTKVKPDTPTIYLRDTVFGLAGSISFVTGLPKAGKSSIIAPIIATAIRPNADPILQIKSDYCNKKMVVYIDTEQTENRTQMFRKRVLKIAKIEGDCSYLETLSFLNYNPVTRVKILEDIFDKVGSNLHMIIIDGLTDFLAGGVNDEIGSNEVIQILMKEAGRTGATVVSIIHENRGSSAARGHIGAEAERKGAAMISIKKDRDKQIHIIESKLARYGADFEPILFRWCKIENDFVELNELETQAIATVDKEALKLEKLQKSVKQAFAVNTELTKASAINNLLLYSDSKGKSEKTGQRLLKECIEAGLLEMKDEKTVKITN